MRELDELKKASVFQYTLIRVQFPDKVQFVRMFAVLTILMQVVLQARFHPREAITAGTFM